MKPELTIGRVLKPRGLKGELKIQMYSSNPDLLRGFSGVVKIDGATYRVQKFMCECEFGYILLDGIDSFEKADALRGKELTVNRAELPPLGNGEHYIVDIIGLDVFVDGNKIGIISDVQQFGSADVYTVRTNDGSLSFPALKQLIKRVDVEEGVMMLDGVIFDRVVVYNR